MKKMLIYLLIILPLKDSTGVFIYNTFSLQTIGPTSISSASLSSISSSYSSAFSAITIIFFAKFTALPSTSGTFITLNTFTLSASTASITSTYKKSGGTAYPVSSSWSSATNKWVLIIGSVGTTSSKYIYVCYIFAGSSTITCTSASVSGTLSISNTSPIVISGSASLAGALHSLQFLNTVTSSNFIQYTLTGNLGGLTGIANQMYSLQVLFI